VQWSFGQVFDLNVAGTWSPVEDLAHLSLLAAHQFVMMGQLVQYLRLLQLRFQDVLLIACPTR